MIGFIFLILDFFVRWYKFLSFVLVKLIAFAVDFLLIFIHTTKFMHNEVSIKISSGYVVYFWDIVFGIVAMTIYGFFIVMLTRFLPLISKVLNYFVAFIGVSVAIPFATSLATSFINIFFINFKHTEHIQLLNNVTADKVLYLVIALVLAIPVWKTRMVQLNS